ncbi:MAG: hypothetical protein H0W75_04640 [Chitinophagaceae bacterium]|nr:hypothetical protein [Chitinophagaceae bacterium]
MKQFLLIITLLLGSFSFAKAQNDTLGKRAEKIQALKIAFITQKLQLTPDEAQKFWPVYNRYETEIRKMMIDKRSGDAIDNEENILNVKKRYRSEFTRVLGQPKTNNLFNAEREFRGVLMRHLKNKQANRPNSANKPNNSMRKNNSYRKR